MFIADYSANVPCKKSVSRPSIVQPRAISIIIFVLSLLGPSLSLAENTISGIISLPAPQVAPAGDVNVEVSAYDSSYEHYYSTWAHHIGRGNFGFVQYHRVV